MQARHAHGPLRPPRRPARGVAVALALVGIGDAASAAARPGTAPPSAVADTRPTDNAHCVAGTWTVAAPDPDDAANRVMPVRYETPHFAFRWVGDVSNDADARAAGAYLESVWSHFIDGFGMLQPFCGTAAKRKVNIFVGKDYGLSGGVDATGTPGMWIGPGGMRDQWGLAHEFDHGLQGGTGGLADSPYTGWLWEDHANWMTHQLPHFRSNPHCSVFQVNYPHLYYGTTRMRYCSWQFLEYVKDRFGYAAIADIWSKAPRKGMPRQQTADPLEVLMTSQGWTLAQFNDLFGEWTMHNVNWDYTDPDGKDQGKVYRESYGANTDDGPEQRLRTTILDPVDAAQRRFAVPFAWAPQRWGYNLVRLHPDAGAASVTVDFRGVVQTSPAVTRFPGLPNEPETIAPPSSDWRWGLVAVDAAGKSRYSPLQRGADGRATLALRGDDRGLYMVVVAAPTTFQHIRFDQPYYSIYRYPWMAQFAGAMPDGYQPDAPPPVPGAHRHANGGGWVAEGATVDATAYVGPQARVLAGKVLGNARVEDHAIVDGGIVQDDARASALSVIRGNTVVKDKARIATTFLGIGEYEQDMVLSDTAQLIGDIEPHGGSAAKGVFYGIFNKDVVTDPNSGANLKGPVPEVTARPDYVWRP